MSLLIIFPLIFIISFVGSLPPNMISITILQKSVESGKKAGVKMALGTGIPQLVYTYIAVYGFDFFKDNLVLEKQLQMASIVIFLVLAIHFYLKKGRASDLKEVSTKNDFNFLRGLIISVLNIMVIPFWIIVLVALKNFDISYSTPMEIAIFSWAATVGGVLAFIIYAQLGEIIQRHLGSIVKRINTIAAIVFIGLAFYQVWSIYVNTQTT